MVSNAIVIGGGIGGLACASALAARGVAVTLLEQAPAITEVGAGLQISPNGLAVLRALGIEDALLRSGAVQAGAVVLADYRRAGEVARLDLGRLGDQRYLFVHRADLIGLLAKAARRANVTVELGARVRRVEPGDPARVICEDGSVRRAELVVGADGLQSVARVALNGKTAPFFTGQVAWRALVPGRPGQAAEARVTMGPGCHIVSYPLRDGTLTNLVAVQERRDWAAEGWDHADDPDNLRAAFAGFSGEAAGLLEQVREVRLWGLFRHPVAPVWQSGGIALIGDAAHPTLPFLAQGANLALEDGWVLAGMADDLAGYQAVRRVRADRVIAASSGNARKYHLREGPLRWAAHAGLRLGSRLVPGLMMRQFDWIYRHDVTRASKK